jgi:hypothetical protein
MSTKNLDNLVKTGGLQEGPATDDEVQGLINRGLVKIEDYKQANLSTDSRFDLAYNAAHALWSGNRYLVFQCAQHTIGLEPEYWRVLSNAHRERNVAEYEGEQLVAALIRVVDIVAERVQELLK